jgi:hypothetical protein
LIDGVGVLVGVAAWWGNWEGVGLVSTVGEGAGCVALFFTTGPVVFWHAERNSSMQMQMNAMIDF